MSKVKRDKEGIPDNAIKMTAGLSLTEKCNLKCKHCYIGEKDLWFEKGYKPKEITIEQIEKLIPKLHQVNVKRINFGGGEVPLHKDFILIAKKLNNAGFDIGLTTNGTTFEIYRDYLHLFNDIGVSIDFPDERHSKWRGRKNVFKRAVKTLEKLVESNIRTEMNTCIMNVNYETLPQLYKLAKDIGVDMWRLNRFHSSKNDALRFGADNLPKTKGCRINNNLSCSIEQLKETFEYLASVTPRNQNYAIPDPLFRTYVNGKGVVRGSPSGKIAFRIMSDGGITPNVFTDQIAGNIFSDELSEIVQGEVFSQYQKRTPSGKCIGCASYNNCEGGDKTDSYLIKGNMNSPDPYCFLDTKKRNDFKSIKFEDTKFVHETYLGTIYVPIKNG